RAGVDDYVVKPCDPHEFAARARALVERERRLRDSARHRSYTLAGAFSAIAFPDLVSIIEMGRRSGTLSIIGPSSVGQVLFDKGRVVHAAYGNLVGPTAFYRLMAEVDGQFEFSPGPCELPEGEQTLTDSLTMLIME